MNERKNLPPALIILGGLAAFVVVVAGMQAAQDLVVPFLLSLFLAILCSPPLFFLKRKGVPSALALLIVITGVLGVGLALFALVGHSVTDFLSHQAEYKQGLETWWDSVLDKLNARELNISGEDIRKIINLEKAWAFIPAIFTGFTGVLNKIFLILITLIFILSEWTIFEDKMSVIYGNNQAKIDRFYLMLSKVRHYMALKCMVSLLTGLLVFIILLIIGVDYPLLWALLTFAMNFIPTIGSIIAAVPPVVLALVQPGLGPWSALWTAAGFLTINTVIGNFIDPRIMGRDLGLSTLVVFLSLVFWGWVLGYVGMLLSVPLTVTAKIMLESSDDTRWLAVLLGSGSSSPEEESSTSRGGSP